MRILIPLIDFGRGGGFRVLSRLATEWARGAEVHFVVPHFAAEPYYPTAAHIIHVDPLGRPVEQRTRSLRGLRRVSLAQLALTAGLHRQAGDGDVILSNHFLTTLAASTSRARGATHVRLMQATEAEYYPGTSPRARLYRRLAERADASAPHVLVNSPEFLPHDPRRLGVVPPGVDRNVFRPSSGPTWSSGAVTIGTIGREEPWKGTDRVLRALSLTNLPSGTRISVANFGADLGPHRGLPIHEVRPRNDVELAAWYQSLDIYVVGAYGQPGAYHYPCLESLSMGVALVTPWYRPANELNSWLVESTDPDQLALAISRAMQDPDGRNARRAAGLATVVDYSWESVGAHSLDLLREAIAIPR